MANYINQFVLCNICHVENGRLKSTRETSSLRQAKSRQQGLDVFGLGYRWLNCQC